MLVEAFVLNGHEGMGQVLWDQIHAVDLDTVGVHADILVYLIAFPVIDYGGLSGGHHIIETDLRGGGKYAPEGAYACGYAADAYADKGG